MRFHPYLQLEVFKKGLAVVVLAWAITASVVAVRNRPEVILIAVEESGTRLIQSASDPLLARERVKFVREFLFRFYHYTSDDFEQAVSSAGNLMSDALWGEKEPEFKRIAAQMKDAPPLRQEARLLDLRELGDDEFEADLAVRVRNRLVDKEARYRVVIQLGTRKRSADNTYPYEVRSLNETETR
jgi:hypothetical protein